MGPAEIWPYGRKDHISEDHITGTDCTSCAASAGRMRFGYSYLIAYERRLWDSQQIPFEVESTITATPLTFPLVSVVHLRSQSNVTQFLDRVEYFRTIWGKITIYDGKVTQLSFVKLIRIHARNRYSGSSELGRFIKSEPQTSSRIGNLIISTCN